MKLLLTTRMGDPYFGLLDDLPDIQKVWATSPDDVAREIVDADVVYGWRSRPASRRRSPSATLPSMAPCATATTSLARSALATWPTWCWSTRWSGCRCRRCTSKGGTSSQRAS